MRRVYKVKRWENVPHRFAQMGLNRLVSDRFGLIFRGVVVPIAGDRSTRNEFHNNLVCWQKHWDFVRRLSPLRLRDGRKVRGSTGIGPPELGSRDRRT